MSNLRAKINSRMDELESLMNENLHLSNQEEVEEKLESITKFWSALSEEDRDYIHGVRYAIEERSLWKGK